MEENKKINEYFTNPKNCGKIENPDGFGKYGDPNCGDYLEVFLKIENEHIKDIKFLCRGCPTAIALSSFMTELVDGKHLDEAAEITSEYILDQFGPVQEGKEHCSNLGAEALYNAILNYVVKSIENNQSNQD